MIRVLESFPEVIELRESFLHVPLVVSAFDFNSEIDGVLLSLVLFEGGDGGLD